MSKPSYLIAVIAGLAGLLSLPATAMEVYKWVDENGGVHYTEAPPPADAKVKSKVRVNTRLPADAAEEQAQRQKDLDKADKADKERQANKAKAAQTSGKDSKDGKDNSEQNKTQCDQMRANLEVMNEHGRVRTTDENGDTHYMSDDEKQKSMDDTQKQIDAFCKS